ncbi:outer membrane beta-barrel protein [uncultured Pseudoteredinibacter sp.]|uniref:outer membrane beta-barrel protein n=1 Tax=uncultured Pseudoteredinibacter sp. TaxID=1641701 RepID=UPI00262F3AFA|nr:outer membrane beta-barrel protein [uncultured Pseudoteredinibacter sp.]
MKLSVSMSLAVLALSLNSPLSYAAEPKYDYVDINAGVAESKIKVGNNSFKLDTKAFRTELSKRINEYTYVRGELTQSRTDDSANSGNIRLSLDDKETNANVSLGVIAKLDPSNHLNFELGMNHNDHKDHGSLKIDNAIEPFRGSGKETDVLWSVAWKTAISDGWELNVRYTKAGDVSSWKLNSPIAISKDVSLDLALIHGKDDSDKRRYESNAATIGLRFHF